MFLWGQMVGMIFVCKSIPLSTNIFVSTIFNHLITECFISYESVMESLEKLCLAFLLQLISRKVFPVSRLLTISMSVRSYLFDGKLRDWENVHRELNVIPIDTCFLVEEMPARATDHDGLPAWWARFALRFWVPSRAIIIDVTHILNHLFWVWTERIKFLILSCLLCSSGSSLAHHRPVFLRRTRERTPFHHHALLASGPRALWPTRFPQHLFSVHDHGRRRSERGPQQLSCHYVGLTVHWAVSVRRSTAGRWPTRKPPQSRLRDDLHPRSDSGRPLRPWVCHHTREPTVLSRVSCRPAAEFWPFTPALPVTLARPLTATETRLAWTGIGEDCRPRTTWRPLALVGSPALPSSPLTGGISTSTRRYHGRMSSHSSLPACATPYRERVTHKKFGTSRVRRRLFCLGDPISAILLKSMSIWMVCNFLNQFSNSGTLRMLHNRMWWPWNSEVHVLVQHCLLVTHVMISNGSFRSLTKCFISNVERFVFMSRTCLRTTWHINHVVRDNKSPCSLMCLFNIEIFLQMNVFGWHSSHERVFPERVP